MLPNIRIIFREDAPPSSCPEDLQALLAACRAQLAEAVQSRTESASLLVYPWPQSGGSLLSTAYAVLKLAADFLYDHPQIRQLDLYCAGEPCYRAYCLQWNMWFAERKEGAAETVTEL